MVKLIAGGDSGVFGILHFQYPGPAGYVRIKGTIAGLTPGKHGFHVHAIGDLGDNCKAAGGHFNPDNVSNNVM